MVNVMSRMRFTQCFDCHKLMYRLPLPSPRDHQVQHKCVGGKWVTRTFGKVRQCKKKHKKDEQNPNGACFITITKEKYLSQANCGRFALMSKSKSTRKKQVVKRRVSRRRAVKARITAKRTVRVKRMARRVSSRGVARASRGVARARRVVSVRRAKKQKRKSKKRAKRVKISSKPGPAPISTKTIKFPWSTKVAKTKAEALKKCSSTPQEVTEDDSSTKIQSTKTAKGNQAMVYCGSSLNPITLDSEEEICLTRVRVPVDDIRIGEYGCARTHFDYPSVQCFEKVFTLYVWDKKQDDEDEKEGKESFEVDIPYSSLIYATFSKSNKLCYCVFETSKSISERRSNPTLSTNGNLEGRFIHDSQSMRKRSIVISSAREDQILLLRKQFWTFFPEWKGLKAKRPPVKSKKYLKSHGLKARRPKRRGSIPGDPELDGEEVILVYPKQGSSHGAVILTMNDLRRLKPGIYLNDNLLDFYLQYLWNEKWDESLRKRVHLFNTFFFKKWSECTQQIDEEDLDYDLSRYTIVRKWTKNVDIFAKDFLVIPVNHKYHWSLAIVCFPGAVLETSEDSKRQCCIVGFDSLRLFRNSHFDEIKRYMNMAWKNRARKSVRELPFARKRCIPLKTPSQNNGADCGLFVLHNCEQFFDQGGFADYKSPSPGVNWYPKSKISQKRMEIFELIDKKSAKDLTAESLKMFRASGKASRVEE